MVRQRPIGVVAGRTSDLVNFRLRREQLQQVVLWEALRAQLGDGPPGRLAPTMPVQQASRDQDALALPENDRDDGFRICAVVEVYTRLYEVRGQVLVVRVDRKLMLGELDSLRKLLPNDVGESLRCDRLRLTRRTLDRLFGQLSP